MKSNRRHQYKQSEKCCRENYRCFSFPANDSGWLMTFAACLVLWNETTKNRGAPSAITGVLPSGRAAAGSSAVNSNGRWWALWVCRVRRTGCRWCSGTGPRGRAGSDRWNMWNTVNKDRTDLKGLAGPSLWCAYIEFVKEAEHKNVA